MGISSLTIDTSVHYTNDHSIFGCAVLIFILDYQLFPSIVVSCALFLSSELHLACFEVSLVLKNFNKPHPAEQSSDTVACHRVAGPVLFWLGVGWGGVGREAQFELFFR